MNYALSSLTYVFIRVTINSSDERGDRVKTSELIKKVKEIGCSIVEHGKEHDKWYSPVTGKYFRIPRHGSKEIATGTANKIMKDSGLK